VISQLRAEKKHGAILRLKLFVFDHNIGLANELRSWQRPFLLGMDEASYHRSRHTTLRQLERWVRLHSEEKYLLEGLADYTPEQAEPDVTPEQVAAILGLPPAPAPPRKRIIRRRKKRARKYRDPAELPGWPRRYRRLPDGHLVFDPEVLKPGGAKADRKPE
jgi:hypothetical protein